MTEAGGYLLAKALGNSEEASTATLLVKVDATDIAQNIYLSITQYWQGKLQDDVSGSTQQFQADNNAANVDQAPANSLVQTEQGVAAQVPQNLANLIRATSDIISLFSFVAQLQSSQS